MSFNKLNIILRDFYTCQNCGERVNPDAIQIAHRIKQDKTQKGRGSVAHVRQWLLDHYGLEMSTTEIVGNIINHPSNVCVTCCSRCNDAMNIFNKPVARDSLLRKIMKDLRPELTEKK